MIDIVYQYIDVVSWTELRHSLRSIEKHFKGECRIWIVGDLPGWVQNVQHIPHVRNNKIALTNCYDACRKMELVINHPELTEDFIYMYDDIYFLKDTTREELEYPLYAVEDMTKMITRNKQTKHQRMRWETYDTLVRRGYGCCNFENHLPKVFSKALMRAMFEMYDPKESRLLFSTLYYNTFFGEIPPVLLHKDDQAKAEFFGVDDKFGFRNLNQEQLSRLLEGKRFLNHNDKGLNSTLKRFIEARFHDKCNYEA